MKFHKDVVIDSSAIADWGITRPTSRRRRTGHVRSDPHEADHAAALCRQAGGRRRDSSSDAEALVEQYRRGLDEASRRRKNVLGLIGNKHTVDWTKYHDVDWFEEIRSGVKPGC